MRQRGVLIAIVGLVAALMTLAPEALAQPRSSQPQRGAPPALPPSGHQAEPVDLNEGKSAAELFQAGCAVCHQSAAGLAKGRRDSELTNFLRQHYTSSVQHASALAGFLTSGGRGGPAVAAPSRQPPIDRPPAPVGRDERKPQEAARPQDQREAPGKRKPQDRPAATTVRTPPAAAPAAPVAAAPEPVPAAETGTSASSPPPEEKPAPPEIPL